jgi:exopolyphosphatase / guanosine-5'-triphosphate,3'-diphosphate pyrophosphatase
MRVAAIDIGTNSVLLLVAEVRGGEIVPVIERARITRLGQGVDRSRALAPDAIARTIAALEAFGEELRAAGAEKVAAVGTSAMRDAEGGAAFRARAGAILGAEPQVISGDEEAALTFAGALTGLPPAFAEGPVTVFDLGGGSTEIIRGDHGRPIEAESLDIGSVRLTERYVRADPPGDEAIAAMAADARRALAGAKVTPRGEAREARRGLAGTPLLVGVAGTVTTLAAFIREVTPYDSACIHGARLTAEEVTRARVAFAEVPLGRRRELPGIAKERADVIVAGAVILEEILTWAGATEFFVSDRGVRWGLAKRLAYGSTGAISAP